MSFGELLAVVIGLLERSGIPYMVTGSLASSYHGEPRATVSRGPRETPTS